MWANQDPTRWEKPAPLSKPSVIVHGRELGSPVAYWRVGLAAAFFGAYKKLAEDLDEAARNGNPVRDVLLAHGYSQSVSNQGWAAVPIRRKNGPTARVGPLFWLGTGT
jgi:hypothetical protein